MSVDNRDDNGTSGIPNVQLPNAEQTLLHKKKDAGLGDEASFHRDGSKAKTIVKPIVNAIAILEYLASNNIGTNASISTALKINTSTCFNILRTLCAENWVLLDPISKTYTLGSGAIKLSANAIAEDGRLRSVQPRLEEFAKKRGATLCVWRRASALRNILVAVEQPGEHAIRIQVSVGQTLPVLLGAVGRTMALRLGLSKKEIKAEFSNLRWFDAPPFEEFMDDANAALQTGWAVDRGNFSPGVVAVSAPVIGSSDEIGYCLTALFFTGQQSEDDLPEIGQSLKALADDVRPMLG